jgi:Protein prenyltransferase, alpha subunit
MGYFRAVHNIEEYSERAFEITTEMIIICPGFYTAWNYRERLIKKLFKSLNDEKEFLSNLSKKHPKNYQIWNYRRRILSDINDSTGEIEFLNIILEIDAKNIHA